jgi:hypothetical protein
VHRRPASLQSSSSYGGQRCSATGEAPEFLVVSKYELALPKLRPLIRDFPRAPFLRFVYGSALSSPSIFDEAAEPPSHQQCRS